METAVQFPQSAEPADNAMPTARQRRYRVSRDYVRTPAEIRLDDDLQHAFASLKLSTRPQYRFAVYAFRRIASGHTMPWRYLSRAIVRAANAAGDNAGECEAQLLAIIARLERFVRDTFGSIHTPRPRFA